MSGRSDALLLIPELDALSVPNKYEILNQLKDRGNYPPLLLIGNKPSYFDNPSTDEDKKDKTAFLFTLNQYVHRLNGN